VLAVIIFFILGFSTASVNAPMGAYILTNTPKELLGRISSLMGMVCLCAIPAGNSLTGIVSEYVSPPVLFLAMGIIITIATLPLLFNKGFRNEENRGAKEQAQVQ
jgi:DHA3 family macrolide efflux protein-like MFS transporter